MKVRVGIFSHQTKTGKWRLAAYTMWFNPAWEGCCNHTVEVARKTEARAAAIAEHRERCLPKE